MARTFSTMLEIGTRAPGFSLPDPSDVEYTLESFSSSRALLVVFMCNHCPFVIHIREGLAAFARDYADRNLAVVGINSNDPEHYPADSPAKMAEEIEIAGYEFPYVFDESQEVAKAYRAACTPDFFLFDSERRLVYRGQFDDSRPGNGIRVTGESLRAASETLLGGGSIDLDQRPSLGCNIKWKLGNEPAYVMDPTG